MESLLTVSMYQKVYLPTVFLKTPNKCLGTSGHLSSSSKNSTTALNTSRSNPAYLGKL